MTAPLAPERRKRPPFSSRRRHPRCRRERNGPVETHSRVCPGRDVFLHRRAVLRLAPGSTSARGSRHQPVPRRRTAVRPPGRRQPVARRRRAGGRRSVPRRAGGGTTRAARRASGARAPPRPRCRRERRPRSSATPRTTRRMKLTSTGAAVARPRLGRLVAPTALRGTQLGGRRGADRRRRGGAARHRPSAISPPVIVQRHAPRLGRLTPSAWQ